MNNKDAERAAAERRNDEQRIDVVCSGLARLESLAAPNMRQWTRRAFKKYSDTVRPEARKLHNPGDIRAIAKSLLVYADELEGQRREQNASIPTLRMELAALRKDIERSERFLEDWMQQILDGAPGPIGGACE